MDGEMHQSPHFHASARKGERATQITDLSNDTLTEIAQRLTTENPVETAKTSRLSNS